MKRILVVSPIPTHPQIAGNRTRILRLLNSLKEMGHEVHFLYVNTEPDRADEKQMAEYWGTNFYFVPYQYPQRSLSRYAGRLRFLFEKGFTEILPVDYRYDDALDEVLRLLSARVTFDVVIVEYIFWSKALECFGDSVLKVLDTHDVFTRRHLLYQQAGQAYGWYCTTAAEEARGLSRADVVIAIQEQEQQYFSTITKKKIVTVRHIAPLCKLSDVQLSRKKILFVGSDAGTNIHGIKIFVTEILPRIRSAFPGLNLLIVGRICDKLDNVDGCVKLGNVEDLAMIYSTVDVVVNPIQFSTGLSIKTIEALGHARPVVTTSSGSKGLEDGANKAFLVEDTPEGFAKAVIQILKDPQLSRRLSETAYRFVESWNNESIRELANVIN